MADGHDTLYKKGENADTGIVFADGVTGFDQACKPGRVLHILCLRGGMSFMLNGVGYNVAARDYVILPDGALVSSFAESPDAESIVMSLSERFVASLARGGELKQEELDEVQAYLEQLKRGEES